MFVPLTKKIFPFCWTWQKAGLSAKCNHAMLIDFYRLINPADMCLIVIITTRDAITLQYYFCSSGVCCASGFGCTPSSHHIWLGDILDMHGESFVTWEPEIHLLQTRIMSALPKTNGGWRYRLDFGPNKKSARDKVSQRTPIIPTPSSTLNFRVAGLQGFSSTLSLKSWKNWWRGRELNPGLLLSWQVL